MGRLGRQRLRQAQRPERRRDRLVHRLVVGRARKLPEGLAQGDRVVAHVKANWWVKGGCSPCRCSRCGASASATCSSASSGSGSSSRAEGLFDLARKKPLPFLPHRIGLVTGEDSDAEKDVLRNAPAALAIGPLPRRTTPPCRASAPSARSSRPSSALDADPEVDVIIVARGGGDFQNLLPFSDEAVVRAAAACDDAVVSAIGHENDRPLLDDVADLRASTPTDAAKRVVPDVSDELAQVQQARTRLLTRVTGAHRHRDRPARADPVAARARERVGSSMRAPRSSRACRPRRRAHRARASSALATTWPNGAVTCARSRRSTPSTAGTPSCSPARAPSCRAPRRPRACPRRHARGRIAAPRRALRRRRARAARSVDALRSRHP